MFESGSCILDGSVASNLKHLQQAYRHIYCTRGTGKVMGVMGLALLAAEIGDSWASYSGVQSLRQGMRLTSAQACPLPVASDNGSEGIAIHAISIYCKL